MNNRGRHSARATRALQKLSEVDPAFASLSLWCSHRDREAALPSEPYAWTDGHTICYAPAFAGLTLDEQIGICAHQILHVAFRHAARANGFAQRLGDRFDADLYNLAADAILNQSLHLAGYVVPRPCPVLSELLAETLGGIHPPEVALGRWDADRLYVRLAHGGGAGREGDSDGNAKRDAARAYAAVSGYAGDLDRRGEGAAQADMDEVDEAAAWRERLTRAMSAGRAAGRGIGILGHRIADLPDPATPWEIVLRGLLARATMRQPRITHQRPTRRWLAMESEAHRRGTPAPVFEPGLAFTRDVPRVLVAIDTSSSVDDALLALFAAQVAGIGRRTLCEVHVWFFDDTVRQRMRMGAGHWESVITATEIPRGGGTDFRPVLAEAEGLIPSVLVMLTDLDGPVGPAPPGFPVVWAVPGDTPAAAAPFGKLLRLDR